MNGLLFFFAFVNEICRHIHLFSFSFNLHGRYHWKAMASALNGYLQLLQVVSGTIFFSSFICWSRQTKSLFIMSNTFSPANWNDKHYNSANVEEERKKTHITNRYWHWGRANKWHVKIYHISKAMKIDKNKFSIFIPIWAEVEGKRKKKMAKRKSIGSRQWIKIHNRNRNQ